MPRRGLLQPLNLSRGGYVERVASSQPLRPEGGSGRQAASASRPRAGEGIADTHCVEGSVDGQKVFLYQERRL